jgi:hypothetical protein
MIMSKVKYAGVALIAVVLLSGCLQSRTEIRVNADGTGTVEETFLMKEDIVQMLASMGDGESFSLLDREELERGAADLGDGVSLQSAEEMSTDWGSGYRAVYAFDDINDLRVNQNPSDDVPSQGGQAGGEQPSAVEYIRFSMSGARPATLEIIMPEPEGEEIEPVDDMPEEMDGPELSEQDMQGLASLYTDMRISVDVVVNGRIVETDATHRDGNRITLVDMDFNRILEEPDVIQRLAQQEAGSISEVERLVNDIPGIKAELKRRVRVRFR